MVILFLVLACVAGAAPNPDRLGRIGPRMQSLIDQGKAAGIVTLLQHHGKVIHHDARGYLKLEDKTPMLPDTIFEIMSMTKPVTATAIVMLAEDGKLAISDPVERHLPEFRGQWVMDGGKQVKPARPITIRDLLTHSSGLAEYPPDGMGGIRFYYNMNRPLAEAVTMYSQMPLLFQPGTRFQYSNPGIATLGRLIEVLSGQAYEQFLEARIFKPLGMKDSFLFPPDSIQSRIANVYQTVGGKLVNMGDGIYRKGARYSFPEGGMYSTAAGMAAFYQCFLAGGKPLLSIAGHETMLAIHSGETLRGGSGWGLGWSVTQNNAGLLDLRSLGAYGHAGAFGTFGWVDPKRALVGVFMVQGSLEATEEGRSAFVEMANAAIE
jgi:CubicO group peptidase (beta-lactamase class C family)